jgi:hypothetical protein
MAGRGGAPTARSTPELAATAIPKAGETANVFIPNPFAVNALALVTVERGLVSRAEVITLNGNGKEYSLALTEDDAPNVYVSVTVLGQGNEFRYGLVNLPVAPDAQALHVQVLSNPTRAGPRDEITFDVQVTDNLGQPVQGEFSFSVVDLASLALADPNAEDILPAFYREQPLGLKPAFACRVHGAQCQPAAWRRWWRWRRGGVLCDTRRLSGYGLLESVAHYQFRRARPGDNDTARFAHHLAGGCPRTDRGYKSWPGGNTGRSDEAAPDPAGDAEIFDRRRSCFDGGGGQ